MDMFNKITFLLGSGVSIPSGLPNAATITDSLLEKNLLRERDQRPYSFDIDNFNYPQSYPFIVEATEGVMILLRSQCDQHLVIRGLGRANYEDIYYLGKQVLDFVNKEYDNPGLMPFFTDFRTKLDALEASLNEKYDRFPGGAERQRLGVNIVTERCLDQIEATVAAKLRTPERIKGLDLLKEILDLDFNNRLRLVTLNHDLILETILSDYGVTDGFAPFSNEIEVFGSRSFDQTDDRRVLILKPHGSVNWFQFKTADGIELYGKCLSGDPAHARDSNNSFLDSNPKRLLLAGTTNKEISYGSGVFLEILFQLHALLNRTSTLVISGYGFRDKGINNRIWAWLENDRKNRIFILHADREELLKSAKASLANAFSHNKNIRIIDKWLCDISLAELVQALEVE